METLILIILFFLGALFFNASHIFHWFLGGEKPNHLYWKLYGIIGIGIWILLFVIANLVL